MKRSSLWYGIGCVLLFALSTTVIMAAEFRLYDGMLGGTPDTQSMVFVGPAGVQSSANGVTTLNTSLLTAIQAGYSPKFGVLPSLDRTNGFTLQFTTQLTAENHSNNNRAGFSVIALANDLSGIELGFWSDRIWAQDGPQFIQLEGAAFDTTIARTYELEVQGATYTLRSGNTLILSGPLRNYSLAGSPYNVPNFIFLGDDTTSASATVRISSIVVVPMEQQYRIDLPLVVR